MFACRVLVAFALAGIVAVSQHSRDPISASEPKPVPEQEPGLGISLHIDPWTKKKRPVIDKALKIEDWNLDEKVARTFYTNGQYKEALDAYTRWQPRSTCANCLGELQSERLRKMAFCLIHLNDYPTTVRVCLEPVSRKIWETIFGGDVDWLLVRIYYEAGQLDDLRHLLAAIEMAAIESHPKPRPSTPTQCIDSIKELRTHHVRRLIAELKPEKLEPWPATLPKPIPGSLPKRLLKPVA